MKYSEKMITSFMSAPYQPHLHPRVASFDNVRSLSRANGIWVRKSPSQESVSEHSFLKRIVSEFCPVTNHDDFYFFIAFPTKTSAGIVSTL